MFIHFKQIRLYLHVGLVRNHLQQLSMLDYHIFALEKLPYAINMIMQSGCEPLPAEPSIS